MEKYSLDLLPKGGGVHFAPRLDRHPCLEGLRKAAEQSGELLDAIDKGTLSGESSPVSACLGTYSEDCISTRTCPRGWRGVFQCTEHSMPGARSVIPSSTAWRTSAWLQTTNPKRGPGKPWASTAALRRGPGCRHPSYIKDEANRENMAPFQQAT